MSVQTKKEVKNMKKKDTTNMIAMAFIAIIALTGLGFAVSDQFSTVVNPTDPGEGGGGNTGAGTIIAYPQYPMPIDNDYPGLLVFKGVAVKDNDINPAVFFAINENGMKPSQYPMSGIRAVVTTEKPIEVQSDSTTYKVKLIGVTSPTQAVIQVGSESKTMTEGITQRIGGLDVSLEQIWMFSTTDQSQNQVKIFIPNVRDVTDIKQANYFLAIGDSIHKMSLKDRKFDTEKGTAIFSFVSETNEKMTLVVKTYRWGNVFASGTFGEYNLNMRLVENNEPYYTIMEKEIYKPLKTEAAMSSSARAEQIKVNQIKKIVKEVNEED
ncbi:MAG: hypothetical protein V1802_00475 [Candidatus Aenigmatarchaeota archaeon]